MVIVYQPPNLLVPLVEGKFPGLSFLGFGRLPLKELSLTVDLFET